jgi:NADPH:quinone reductase
MPKAVRFYEFGGPEVLKLEEVALQRPGRREVRLKIEACALNRADILLREDRHAVKVTAFPSPIGYEASGIIDGVGEDISEFKVGDRVNTVPVGMHHCLCAESAVLPVEAVSSYPETLTPIEATSAWMQYLTAWGALIEYGALRATDTVVVSAASSSAGVGAIQLLKDAGARSIATTTSSSKKPALLRIGADHVIVTSEENFGEAVMRITNGQGARLIYDPIGGDFTFQCGKALAEEGIIFVYGMLDPDPPRVDLYPDGPEARSGAALLNDHDFCQFRQP